jgi:hypothetical protein
MIEFWNETTQILLPGFGFKNNDIETLNFLVQQGLVNAYLCSQYKVKSDIYLKFQPKKVNSEFISFYRRVKEFSIYKHTLFKKNGEIVIILEYPPNKYESIYLPFINSKWENMDKNYRNQKFCKNYIYKGELKVNRRWEALNTNKVKDCPKLDINTELYTEK